MDERIKFYSNTIAKELDIEPWQVYSAIKLFESGSTIPFVARYRKEATGSLEEVSLSNIKQRHNQLVEIDERRNFIIETITSQGNLTDDLNNKLLNARTLIELEDLYLPFKPKRRTKAEIARQKGLEPLAQLIFEQNIIDLHEKASHFIDTEKEVINIENALEGARHIIAEWVNEDIPSRNKIRKLFINKAIVSSKPVKDKELEGIKYQNYFDSSEVFYNSPSHRVLAILRGEAEGFLKVTIEPDSDLAIDILEKAFIKNNNSSAEQVKFSITDSYKRLLKPSIESEFRNEVKKRADAEAIKIFATNLQQLLMYPPLGEKNVLAIDPGFSSGCKIVCLNKQGKLLHNETIYPHPPQNQVPDSVSKLQNLVSAYQIEAIAIGNGTAGRETENFVRRIPFARKVFCVIVNESGASIYSASAVARSEFPNYDITVRGAISIGRRLMDPLSELVKIDPKSIGVGQYQHDVNQIELQKSLSETVEICVNKVGVELNTASKQILSYVSGVGNALAENIVNYRDEKGAFSSRDELLKVKRFGTKAFEQAAGFLRIQNGSNPLDKSAVHPESYHIVYKMAKHLNCSVDELMNNNNLRKQINPNDFVNDDIGEITINDILNELDKPGRDPRDKFDLFEFDPNINSIKDLKIGMKLNGIVRNIAAFGAFVDIGVHQEGLVHISNLANKFVKNPNEIVKLNQQVKVIVLDVDIANKRIALSMKDA